MLPFTTLFKRHHRKARRTRRGLSMITVVFGMVIGAAVLVPIMEEAGRVQKRGLGQRMAEEATLFAETWENLVRECALIGRKFDPAVHTSTDLVCAGFPDLDYAAWTSLNEGAVFAVRPVTLSASGLHRSNLKPFSFTNSGPVEVLRGLTARAYIVSVAQEDIATGFVVFTVADWIDPLTRATFKDAIDLWTDRTVDGEEITTALDAFRALHPTLSDGELAVLMENDVPAMTFSRFQVEPDWVLREPMVGAPGIMDSDLLLSADLSGASSIEASGGTLAIARSASVPTATGEIVTQDADVLGQGTAQGMNTGSVTSGPLTAGSAGFVLSLTADQLTTGLFSMTARSVSVTGTEGRTTLNAATGESAAAGALKGGSLTLPSLRIGSTFVANAQNTDGTDYLRLQSVTASGSVVVGTEVLGNHLDVPSLMTGSCAGC